MIMNPSSIFTTLNKHLFYCTDTSIVDCLMQIKVDRFVAVDYGEIDGLLLQEACRTTAY